MREVRMTFGEHLEELRRRIIVCLLYLVIGVSISMMYGEHLLQWVLVPHYTAVRTESRARLVRRLERSIERIKTLASVDPRAPTQGAKPLLKKPPGPDDWAVLFAREVALEQVRSRLELPFENFSASLARGISSLSASERDQVVQAVRAFGGELAVVMVQELAFEIGAGTQGSIPEQFRRFHLRARELSVAASAPNQVEKLIGWGGDLSRVIALAGEVEQFLDGRRDQAKQNPIPLERLHVMARTAELPQVLGEVLTLLDKDLLDLAEEKTPPIMVTSYLENFMAYLKVAIIFGIFLTLPFLLYELWKFIGAGLYPQEQKHVVTFLPFSLGLFIVGMLFGYFALIPVGLKFLAGWGIEDVNLSFTLENYIGLFLTLTLILGLVFQTPLIMVFLARIGVADVATFRRSRKVSIFAGICLAVVLTPPDPFSWSLMAAPMILLYELGIWVSRLIEVKKPRPATPA